MNQPRRIQRQEPSKPTIFDPAAPNPATAPLSSRPTKATKPKRRRNLRYIYDRYIEPRLIEEEKKPATLREYITHISSWEKYWTERRSKMIDRGEVFPSSVASDCTSEGTKTPKETESQVCDFDPPVAKIKEKHLERFRAWLLVGRRGNLTVNKYLKTIRTIMLVAVGKRIISDAPKLRSLKARKNADKIFLPLEHVDKIYNACPRAVWPKILSTGVELCQCVAPCECNIPTPGAYWRAAIVLFFNFGFRTQELMSYDKTKKPLLWENVVFSPESPGLSHEPNPDGWIWYVPTKQEADKPEPLVLAMSPTVRAHIDSIRPPNPDPKHRVFPYPYSGRMLRSCFDRIVRISGVTPKIAQSGKRVPKYLIKHFRKTAITWHNRNRPGLSKYVIGHGDRNAENIVSDTFYNNPEMAAMDALLSIPQPESFKQIFETGTRQRELF